MDRKHHCNKCPNWYVTKKQYPSGFYNITICKKYNKQLYYLFGDENQTPHQAHTDLEYVAEQVFNHEPSENELIYFMAANGATPYGYYVTVEKGYRYNREYD